MDTHSAGGCIERRASKVGRGPSLSTPRPKFLSTIRIRSVNSAPNLDMDKPPSVPASFEAALAELEAIVATMEGGQLPLEESLAAYKRGAVLLQYCQSTLRDAEQQVRILEKGMLVAPDALDPGNDES